MNNFSLPKDYGGWLCLDKAPGMSSNSAMIKVRKMLGVKTGYIGTLDPFATGILPIAVGDARKFIPYIGESSKEYTFTVVFGKTTDSLDVNGKVVATSDKIPTHDDIIQVLPYFVGDQMQIPPVFSAIKINGRRACDRVRRGETVELASRKISIFSIKLIHSNNSGAEPASKTMMQISCSKGTYVRSLARDIAKKLGTVAYVESLCRTKSGFFSPIRSLSLEKLVEIGDTQELMRSLIPIESPLDDIPALHLDEHDVLRLRNGLTVSVVDRSEFRAIGSSNVLILDKSKGEKFTGIGFISEKGSVKALRMCAR